MDRMQRACVTGTQISVRVIPIKYSQSLDAMKWEKDRVCFGLGPQSPPSSIALLFLCEDFFPQPSSGTLATVSCF